MDPNKTFLKSPSALGGLDLSDELQTYEEINLAEHKKLEWSETNTKNTYSNWCKQALNKPMLNLKWNQKLIFLIFVLH